MPDFAVSTSFNAKGDMLKKIGMADKGMKKFGDTATRSFRKASKGANSFGGALSANLASRAITSGLTGLRNGLQSTAMEFVAYDQAITSATAKFKGLDRTTKAGQKTIENLKNTARELGATTEFSATQAAEGLDFLAMAGFTADQAIATLPGVVDLATVANVDLARATDIASDSLGAFGLMTTDTAQLQKNFTRTSDVMAKTMTTSNTSMEALFESITSGGPAFVAAGQSMETFSAFAGVMANAGIKGSESGTSLRNVMLRLAKPAGEAADVMGALGVKTQDSQGNFRDIIDILADFETGLEGMGDAQRTAALTTVFGARSVTGINILLKEGTESLRDYRGGLIASSDASKDMASVVRQSIGNQLASLRSAAIELGFKFVDAFDGKITPAIEGMTQAIRGINVPAIVEGFTKLINVGLKFKAVLFGLAAGWVAFKLAMGGAALIQGIASFISFVKVLKSAAAAQGILNLVMTANPIGAIAVGIGLLIGGLTAIVVHFGSVGNAFKAMVDLLARFSIGAMKTILFPFEMLKSTISGIIGFFTGGGGDVSAAAEVEQRIIAERAAPNETALAAQEVQFNGQLNIAGAPEGSTFESTTAGAPAIQTELIGAQ